MKYFKLFIILPFFLYAKYSFCQNRIHLGFNLKKEIQYNSNCKEIKSNNFNLNTSFVPQMEVRFSHILNRKFDINLSILLYSSAYKILQNLHLGNDGKISLEFKQGYKSIEFPLGIKYNLSKKHFLINSISIQSNIYNSRKFSTEVTSDSAFNYTYEIQSPFKNYISFGYKLGYLYSSKKINYKIHIFSDFVKRPTATIKTTFSTDNNTMINRINVTPFVFYISAGLDYNIFTF
jgi:hypothetical protein